MRVLIVEDESYLAEAIRDGLRLEAIAADQLDDNASGNMVSGTSFPHFCVVEMGKRGA